jgi:DNA repair protein RadC
LLAACNLVEIVLLDHIIVGESDHYSYSDSGRLKQLERE